MAGDGPKVTPEQLAMMDQLNQKLANAEITAREYADAIKQGGLEQAHAISVLDQQIAKMQQLLDLYGRTNTNLKEQKTLQDSINVAIADRNSREQGGQAAADQGTQTLRDKIDAQKNLNAEQKAFQKELQKSNVWGQDFLMKLAQGESAMDALIGKGASLGKAMENIGAGALESLRDAFIKNIGAADSMLANFNKMSGQAGAMNQVIMDSRRGVGSLGVSMQDAGAAAGALYQDFNQFSGMNDQMKTELIQTTASLENLGMAASDQAKNIELAVGAFGMGTTEAMGLNDELAKTAMAIGMPPAKLGAEFAKAAPQLSVYGKKGIEVFKNMAAASKGLGIEMGTLLNLTSQFDTFEGAATAAGNLNAMLGGDLLNSMDMLNATEEERIRMILQSVDASGKSWSSMGKFEKMAVANAAGITDMAEANKLFSGGLKGYDDSIAKMEANKKSEEELAAAKAASVDMTKKLEILMQQFAVALLPAINFIHGLMNGVLRLNDAFGGYLIPVVVGGTAAIYSLFKVIQFVKAMQEAWRVATTVLTGAQIVQTSVSTGQAAANTGVAASSGPAALGTKLMGIAALAAAPGMAALAIGVGLLALGFGLLAISVALVFMSFVELIGMFMEAPMAAVQAAGALVVLGVAVALLTVIFAALAPIAPVALASMIMLGTGMMFLAPPIILLSIGMMLMGQALQLLNPAIMLQVAATLPIFAMALLVSAVPMMLAASLFAPAAVAVGFGLAAIGLGLMLIAPNVGLMPTLALGLVALAWGLFGAAFPMAIAAAFFVPAAINLAVGLAAIGLGLMLIAPNVGIMATLGFDLMAMAFGLMLAAPMLLVAGIILSVAAIPFMIGAMGVGIGLAFLAIGIQGFKGMGKTMKDIATYIIPFALAMITASPFLLVAGILLSAAGIPFFVGAALIAGGIYLLGLASGSFTSLLTLPLVAGALLAAAPLLLVAGILMGIAGGPFMFGAMQIGIGLAFLSIAAPRFPQMLLLPQVAAALLAAAPLLFFAGIIMAFAGPSFIVGAILVGIGMAILAGPLMQFAQAVAVLGPFIPSLAALAVGLMLLGFALPIFGFGLLMLGIVASLPFFDTGLEVLSEALYIFADAMSGIPTEKAVALGQIFQGLGGLTDMEGVGSALMEFAFGVMVLGAALTYMPDGPTLMMMAEGLKLFAETGAQHVLPVSIALYAAAPYLLAAGMLLAPAAFFLMIAGPPLAAAMFWIALAFAFIGNPLTKAGMETVNESFMGAAIGLFIGAPLLLIASVILAVAAPFFLFAAYFIAIGMMILNEPLMQFAQIMLLMAPILPLLPAMAQALLTLGLALPVFGFGLFMLGIFASLPFFETGLNTLASALYIFADAMSTIPTEKAVALGQIFQGLAAMTNMEAMADGLYGVAGAIWFLSFVMGSIPEETLFKMKMVFDNALDPLNELAQNMTPEVAVNAGALVTEAERYGTVQATMKSFNEDAFAQAVVGAAKAAGGDSEGGGEGGEGGKGQDVVLVLNEREFGRAIEVYMNKRIPLGVS